MKLKDKLAKEHTELYSYAYQLKDDDLTEAYIAGFEKARELATYVHSECGAACGCCLDIMEQLGEEIA